MSTVISLAIERRSLRQFNVASAIRTHFRSIIAGLPGQLHRRTLDVTSSALVSSPNRLVADFHYLCSRGARKFVRAGVERADLEQVAAIGLIKASRRYDAAKETPFEAYAWIVILGELLHYVRDHERAIRMPRRLLSLERHIAGARETLLARHRREPSDAEIGEALGVLATTVAEARRAKRATQTAYLDDVVPAAHASIDALGPEDRFLIERAFASLSALERRIIAGIYLVGLTQAQIAAAMMLSPKRVSRVHLAALARMRRFWADS